MYNKLDGVVFDLDGTLFQTEKLALPAFKRTFLQLENEGYYIGNMPSDDDLLSVIGMILPDIWHKLLPNQSREVHLKANEYMLLNELNGLNEGYGALYPNVIETLFKLKSLNVKLFIASNGAEDYVQAVTKAFKINHFFDAVYSAGHYKTKSKIDLLSMLARDFNIDNGVMVGDRQSDVEAGKGNDFFVIGCQFGFSNHTGENNELRQADIKISGFEEILPTLRNRYNFENKR